MCAQGRRVRHRQAVLSPNVNQLIVFTLAVQCSRLSLPTLIYCCLHRPSVVLLLRTVSSVTTETFYNVKVVHDLTFLFF